jgi:hypothetical protein
MKDESDVSLKSVMVATIIALVGIVEPLRKRGLISREEIEKSCQRAIQAIREHPEHEEISAVLDAMLRGLGINLSDEAPSTEIPWLRAIITGGKRPFDDED